MVVVFVVPPLRGWARVAPPLVVGSSLRDSAGWVGADFEAQK